MANDKMETKPAQPTGLDRLGVDWPRFGRWPELFHRLSDTTIKIEEFDEDSTHVVRAEMPGIDPDEDVEISVDHGVLSLWAERREEKKTESDGGYRSEFSYGSFTRSVSLPPGATEDDVTATYRDGILEVRFPIDGEVAKSRKVPVVRA
jgi:HSP20 family protein